MEEIKFQLGQKVKIPLTGRDGTVEGFWQSVRAPVQYDVQYADANGVLHNKWLRAEELVAA